MTTKHPASIITVYNGDARVYRNDYPAEWTLPVLQQIARRWMRHTHGTRYTITGATQYQSKPSKRTKGK